MSKNKSGCRSCLLWLACIFVGLALVVGIAAYLGYRKAQAFLDQYAQKQPLTLPVVHYSQAELQAVHKQIDQFLVDSKAGRTNARLALSANDLNALIVASGFSNRVYITLESNVVAGRFSVPLVELGMPLFRDRYLNGAGTLDVGCVGGGLSVSLKDAAVNGLAVPEHYLKYIRDQNFARGLTMNSNTLESLQRVGRVAVENGKLVFEVGNEGK